MLTALRLHWRFGAIVAIVATASLAGLAIARVSGLEQMRRVTVACVNSRIDGQIAFSGRLGVAQHMSRPCHGAGPRLRGISQRKAIGVPLPRSAPGANQPSPTVKDLGTAAVASSPAPSPELPPPPPADTTPPQTSITSGPPATTTATTATLRFSSNEAEASFECNLDGAGWGTCLPPGTYTSLDVGSHEFAVRAIDAADNIDPTPASRSWTVVEPTAPPPPDTTPPQTSIVSGPGSATTATSASLSFSSSEAGSSFECNLDGPGWGSCTSPKAYSGLALGSHEFSVRATDAAGNVDTTPATRSWTVEAPLPPPPPPPPPAECSTAVSSVAAAESAVDGAAAGAVVCLADGSYGAVTLSASKSAEVTLQAEHPGRATIAGATLDGSHLTLSRFDIANEVTVEPGASAMTIEYNRISGGYMGINAGPTTSTSISDTTIRGNQLVGPFGEDALRINRYHDSADPDPYGILIEANEISGVRENGAHSDCLQSVWGGDGLYFRRNYLHDNRCQGFFVKDQPETIVGIGVEDNLFVRNNEPCDGDPGCGQPSYFQVFGPYQDFTMRRNTIWQGDVVATFQEGAGSGTSIESNVIDRLWTSTDLSGIIYANNTRCQRETAAGGSWPSQTPGETVDCAPAFNDPASDDFRLLGSDRGVDWAPAEQHYGP